MDTSRIAGHVYLSMCNGLHSLSCKYKRMTCVRIHSNAAYVEKTLMTIPWDWPKRVLCYAVLLLGTVVIGHAPAMADATNAHGHALHHLSIDPQSNTRNEGLPLRPGHCELLCSKQLKLQLSTKRDLGERFLTTSTSVDYSLCARPVSNCELRVFPSRHVAPRRRHHICSGRSVLLHTSRLRN